MKLLAIYCLSIALVLINLTQHSRSAEVNEQYLDEISCSKRQVFSLDEYTTLVVKLKKPSGSNGWKPYFNMVCQFMVLPSYGSVMVVAQRLDLRSTQGSFTPCTDFIRYTDKSGDSYGPICGKVDGRSGQQPVGLIGPRSFNSRGGILVTIQFGGTFEDLIRESFQIELAFTQFSFCTNMELLLPGPEKCSDQNGQFSKCISQKFNCDGIINCGFEGSFGLDEAHCPSDGGSHMGGRSMSQIFSSHNFGPMISESSTAISAIIATIANRSASLPMLSTTPQPLSFQNATQSAKTQNVTKPNMHMSSTYAKVTHSTPLQIFLKTKPTVPAPVVEKARNPFLKDIIPTGTIDDIRYRNGTVAVQSTQNITQQTTSDILEPSNVKYPLDGAFKFGYRGNQTESLDEIRFRLPVTIFGLLCGLAGGAFVLLFSVGFCCLVFKSQKSKQKYGQQSQCFAESNSKQPSFISLGYVTSSPFTTVLDTNKIMALPGYAKRFPSISYKK